MTATDGPPIPPASGGVAGPGLPRVAAMAPAPEPRRPELTPAQRDVLDLLGASRDERPTFDAGLRHELRAELEAALEPLVPDLGTDTLFINKRALTAVHACEGRYLAEREEPFAWSPAIARGTVAHKAIELSVGWRGEPVPGELVDEALARLTHGSDSVGDWLQTATEADVAELRALATEQVTTFLETFPPLEPRWRPVTESRVRVELCDGAVVLSGKIDLSLGRADGTTAGKVIIDLKSGSLRPEHVDDLRFYALLETIRLGTPPRLVATYALDQGRPMVERVTVDVLAAALRRTIAGAARMVAVTRRGEAPALRPSRACRWCAGLAGCEVGRTQVARDDEDR